MLEEKPKFNFLRVLAWVLIVVLLVGGGFMLYRIGFTRGAVNGGMGDMDFFRYNRSPHGSYFFSPFSHVFFPGGLIIGLLFLFLIIGLFRRAFFGARWGMRRTGWEDKAEKWHAEQHAKMEGQSAPPTVDVADAPEPTDTTDAAEE